MGLIIRKELAEITPCTCYPISRACGDPSKCPEDYICFSKGVIGALDDIQDLKLCSDYIIVGSSRLEERADKFKLWGKIADVCLEEDDFLDCVIREARRLKKYH